MKACGARAAVIKGSKGAEGKWATRYRVWKHGTSILTQHLSDILDACQTDDQCTQRASYVEAWRNYEAGVTIPAEVILQVIDLTAVEVHWLLTGDGPMYRRPSSRPRIRWG